MARVAAELREIVGGLDPACVDGRDALGLVRVAADVERLGATAKALLAQRCVDTGVWKTDRSARVPATTPAEWLADVSGSGIGPAKDALAVSEALSECPRTDAALRSGELSLSTAREVTAAAAIGGESAEQRVLRSATRDGLRGAKDESRRVLATAADAEARAAKIHHHRSRRRWITREGIWNLHLEGPVSLGAEIEACLAPFDDAAWDIAPKQPKHARDTPDAIAFDGLLLMARAARDGAAPTTGKPRGRAKTRPHVVAHVDATSLVSGATAPGERCEIAGVGPVPVAHVRELLGDAMLTILVEDGRDVRTFARPGRKKVTALTHLLDARDTVCTITGCNRAQRLEHDHRVPVSDGGDTAADNLEGLCRPHHRHKTEGWKVADHPDGRRTLDPPPGTRHTAAA